jgi:ATP-dependent Clp protease ATP-binding subunit ClpA
MLERLTTQARAVLKAAMREAYVAGTITVGCEHLLIGIAGAGPGPAADALGAAGLDQATLAGFARGRTPAEPLDADALALLGIDLDGVRRAAESAFGPGALDRPGRPARRFAKGRMSGDAKKAMELALRDARQRHDRTLSPAHLLIGLIDQGDNAATELLTTAGADLAALRADTARRMTAAAAA